MFVAYSVGLDLIRALRPVVKQLRAHNLDIAKQVERAGTSVLHNLGEGSRLSVFASRLSVFLRFHFSECSRLSVFLSFHFSEGASLRFLLCFLLSEYLFM